MVKTALLQATGKDSPYVLVLPPPVVANRAPRSSDIMPVGQLFVDNSITPNAIYTSLGNGTFESGGNNPATLIEAGIVFIATPTQTASGGAPSVDYVAAANDVSSAIAAASFSGSTPATIAQEGVVYLATNAMAVTPGTVVNPNTVLIPSNLASVFAAPPAIGGTTPAVAAFTTLAASGAATLSSTLAVTSNATVGGTLGVTGASTIAALSATSGAFSTTLSVTGASTIAALSASRLVC